MTSPVRPTFIPGVALPTDRLQPALWFIFRKTDLLVQDAPDGTAALPPVRDPAEWDLPPLRFQYLGQLGEAACFSAEVPADAHPPAGMEFVGLRKLHGRLTDDLFWIAARAIQIVDWDGSHQFCGRCGAPTVTRKEERAKECTRCGLLHFPRIAPAVITAVEHGDEILLARSSHFQPGMFSVIAGFVEPGETLEQAAVREIREEVGIEVRDLRYFASQPWPFPHSLMIAFTARYASGDLKLDPHEIEEAHWFHVEALPTIPGPLSISRRLIDSFVARHRI